MKGLTRSVLLAFIGATAVAAAGDPQPQSAPAVPAPAAPAAAPTPTSAPTAAADLQDFVPTEKVSADDAVAFPTDI